ncbi:hypothetical protein HPB48_003101 [Haemaphysalis longicornis]|uniref:TLC domain-containing protein n=1 Tax=Haemaphysalis longicornis TaxID=44386 RepID=A0A9J6FNR3_HAELO|nr:hypothetical protein HPB48_003101 [Haemaphysalis longicornis]
MGTKFLANPPLGLWLRLEPSNVAKLPESAWKLLYYGCVWMLTVYVVVLQGKYRFFQEPCSVWDGWSPDVVVPGDIWWIYAVQSSYYVHGMYAVLYQDLWRKDSAVMLAHHSLTLMLLGMSYTFRCSSYPPPPLLLYSRCHNIGVLVLVLHDLSDVLLEFSKLNVYLKVRASRRYALHDHVATASFACFAITWFVMRLHYYPRKVMYAASTGLFVKQVFPSHYLFFLALLSVLLLMNLYWFALIVLFTVRVLTGDIQELDDTREYDVAEKLRSGAPTTTSSSTSSSNGRHLVISGLCRQEEHLMRGGGTCHRVSKNAVLVALVMLAVLTLLLGGTVVSLVSSGAYLHHEALRDLSGQGPQERKPRGRQDPGCAEVADGTSEPAAKTLGQGDDGAAKQENGFQNGWHGGLRERRLPQADSKSDSS